MTVPTGRLAALLAAGEFVVTGEIVPPVGADGEAVTEHARGLVGYVDAVNVTDNPAASPHMSPLAGARFAAEAGLEATLQVTARDRNRIGLTSDLLGGWALGARNLLCLSGDPMGVGDHPDAATVDDLDVLDLIRLARRLRDEGTTLAGKAVAEPPRYLIGVAELPFADPYDPSRLEAKLDAGADFVMTQIVYDAERLAAWADVVRPSGLFERAAVIVGLTPLRSAKQARFMDEKLPGVSVPPSLIADLETAGEDAPSVGLAQAQRLVADVRRISGLRGIHVMTMGHDATARDLVERTGLFPRPVALSAQPRSSSGT